MKLHKGLSAFLVKEPMMIKEIEALAKNEGIKLVRLNEELIAASQEDGIRLEEILRRKNYFPRSISSMGKRQVN